MTMETRTMSTARTTFNAMCETRWEEGRCRHGPTLKMRHPAVELLEELSDAMNYARAWTEASDREMPRVLLYQLESMGAAVQLHLWRLEASGVRLDTCPSSVSSTLRTYSRGNSHRRGSK